MRSKSLLDVDVSNFLPHRKPMLMVDSVVENEDDVLATQFYIAEDCVFLKNGKLCEAGLMENAAQAASGVVGQTLFDADDVEGRGSELVGYISAIRKVDIYALPEVGDTIVTRAKLSPRVDTGAVTMCRLESEA